MLSNKTSDLTEAEKQLDFVDYSSKESIKDYMNIMIYFGYMTMFSVASPTSALGVAVSGALLTVSLMSIP